MSFYFCTKSSLNISFQVEGYDAILMASIAKKMKKKNVKTAIALHPSPFKIFSDPKKSRVLWHDTKTFASASTIYLENMLSGVYGKLPSSLKPPLANLQVAAVIQLIVLENNSIFNKLELDSLQSDSQQQTADEFVNQATHFLAPVFRRRGVAFDLKIAKGATLNLDQRYGSTLLQNLLLLSLELCSQKASVLRVVAASNHLKLEISTRLIQNELEDRLNKKHIYSQKREQSSLPALLYQISLKLAHLFKAKLSCAIKNKKLIIMYGQK